MTNVNQTDKALSIADKAVRVMNSSTENLKKVIGEFTAFAEQSASLILEIEFKQNELDNINDKLVVKVREQEAELRLQVKENEFAVLQELLGNRSQVAISVVELKQLRDDLAEAVTGNQEEIDVAVKAEETRLALVHRQEISRLQAAQAVETAELKAKLSNLVERNEFFQNQVAHLQNELGQERTSRVEVEKARAGSNAVVVHNGPTK